MFEKSDLTLQFNAVGGHKSSIFYGETTRDGRTTLRKKTTAWEIIYYLAMELAKEEEREHQQKLGARSAAPRESDALRTKFIYATGKLAAFTPKLFSLHFPENYVPKSTELKSHAATMSDWVALEEGSPARALMAPLFHELFDGAESLKGFDEAYDTGIWGIGLINEASCMIMPCVMDVKIGFIRHSPLTPEDKVERMMKKERNSLMRNTALRICGCQRYVNAGAAADAPSDKGGKDGGEGMKHTCERFGKEIGYATSDVAELSNCLKLFFSSVGPLAETTMANKLVFHSDAMALVPAEEKAKMHKRVADICAEIKALLQFFEATPQGGFLLQHMAFVSASVLMLYDAAASPATARLRFIDFARSTWRKFNFDEAKVGFVQGLKNLDAYLA